MKLKTKIALLLFVVFLSTTSNAQNKKEERKAKKIAFITQFLDLTPKESKAFWPIYEERNAVKLEKLKPLRKGKKQAKKKLDEMSDDEILKLLNNTLDTRQIELDIQREYTAKFLSVLPPKKLAKLYHIERKFKQRQKKQLKKRKGIKK